VAFADPYVAKRYWVKENWDVKDPVKHPVPRVPAEVLTVKTISIKQPGAQEFVVRATEDYYRHPWHDAVVVSASDCFGRAANGIGICELVCAITVSLYYTTYQKNITPYTASSTTIQIVVYELPAYYRPRCREVDLRHRPGAANSLHVPLVFITWLCSFDPFAARYACPFGIK
jgi:hypothetical protein